MNKPKALNNRNSKNVEGIGRMYESITRVIAKPTEAKLV
jgi:hypothetical protein